MTKKLILSISFLFLAALAFCQVKGDVYEWSWLDSTYHEVSVASVSICKSSGKDIAVSTSFLSTSSMRICSDAILTYSYVDNMSMQKVYVSDVSEETPDIVYVSGSISENPYLFMSYDPNLGDYKFKIFIHDKVDRTNELRR